MRPPLTLLALLCLLPAAVAADGPVPPREAAGKFTVPEGFRVTLFAGEPDIAQPIAFTFDGRGRLWLVECLSYPNWRADGKGRDRVVILEDTDGDGKFDKKTVVFDDGVNLSGIELGTGGVWLCSTPNLLFVPIKDDKPSGPAVVHLDGWHVKDARHNVFNSLAWGPDGWLYGCSGLKNGSRVGPPGTPDAKRAPVQPGVWRYRPTERRFEQVAVGMANPWGLDWDERGELFATNCVVDHLFHVVPGGRYLRAHSQDPDPHTYGQMTSAVDYKHWGGGHWTESRADKATGATRKEHDEAGGGHAHSGAAVYLGCQFPAEYRGTLFACNIHGGRLNNDGLTRTPGGMKGVRRPDFALANDPWFRGVAVKQGPDGSLYVCDWSDTGECHNATAVDRTGGRLFRISYGTPKPFKGDVAATSDAELIEAQASKDEWLVRHARRVLRERAAAGKAIDPAKLVARLDSADEPARLRAYWALAATGNLTDALRDRMAADPGEAARAWAARLDADALLISSSSSARRRATRMAEAEASPFVRAALAHTATRLGGPADWPLLRNLLRHPADDADANLTLLYWLAVKPHVPGDPAGALALARETPIGRVRSNIVRYLLTLPGTGATAQLALVAPAIVAAKSDDARRDYLDGVRLAFEGRADVEAPPGWPAVTEALAKSSDPRVRRDAEAVAVLVGDPAAIAAMRARLTSSAAPAEERRFALQQLLARRVPGMAAIVRGLLNDRELRAAAIRALAAYPDAASVDAILAHYASFNAAEKGDAVQTLASRPAFALALLDAVGRGAVPKGDIDSFTARQLLALNEAAVSAKLAAVWGTVRPASATRAAQTAKLKALLTPDTLAKADLGNGRRLYAANCAACHKLFGDGGEVGPELTGSQRANLDYVLENVLDPSAVVPADYRLTTFALADGRTVSGIVRRETRQALTVRTLNEEVVVAAADIASRKQTQLSIMPDGLFDKLTDAEVRDLVGYLAAPRQVPLPAVMK